MKKNLKKLVLSKETLNNLTQPSLKGAQGGMLMRDGIVETGCGSECTMC